LIKVKNLKYKNLLNPGLLVKLLIFLDRPSSTRQLELCITYKNNIQNPMMRVYFMRRPFIAYLAKMSEILFSQSLFNLRKNLISIIL